MKKMFLLFLLSIPVMIQKNYSQILDWGIRDNIDSVLVLFKKGPCNFSPHTKPRYSNSNYNTCLHQHVPDKLNMDTACIIQTGTIQYGVNPGSTPLGFPFNPGSIYPIVEDMWIRAFSGMSIHH